MVCYGMVWFAHKYENTALKFCAIDRPYSGKKKHAKWFVLMYRRLVIGQHGAHGSAMHPANA